MVSIDGMHPDYVRLADQYGLKIPVLRRLYRDGAHARGVRGVLPTVTFPSHTTLLTGVWPVRHGIFNNTIFDPTGKDLGDWYWYSEDVRVPTLWKAASEAGYTVGSVSWPVSVGAPGIVYNIPEYWRTFTSQEMKLLKALSTPGLISELEKDLGPYTNDLNNAIPGDWTRTRFTEALIRKKHANFVTLHLASLDHLEHAHKPFSRQAFETLEAVDGMAGTLEKAILDSDSNGAIAVVSDHGFATIDRQLNPAVELMKAGLLTLNAKPLGSRTAGVAEWKASVWSAGGSAAILLKDDSDLESRAKVQSIVERLASDPQNGIERVLNRQQIKELGGDPKAEFVIDMKPGFSVGTSLDGPLVRAIPAGGTHGYAPTHGEMQASFFIAGPSIQKGKDLGEIDMRSIAPTLASFLGIKLPSADLPGLPVQLDRALK
jgi:predicted AlkP superfamily pyrophosphatase or phosphodiesterase